MENGQKANFSGKIETTGKKFFVFINFPVFPIIFILLLLFMDFEAISGVKFGIFYWIMVAVIDAAVFGFHAQFIGPLKDFDYDYEKEEGNLSPESIEKHWKNLTGLPQRLGVFSALIFAVAIGGGGIGLHLARLYDLWQALIQLATGLWVGTVIGTGAYAGSIKLLAKPLDLIADTKHMPWAGRKISIIWKQLAMAMIICVLPITIIVLQLHRLENEQLRKMYADSITSDLKIKVEYLKNNPTPPGDVPYFMKNSDYYFFIPNNVATQPKAKIKLFSFNIFLPDYFTESINDQISLARRTDSGEWNNYKIHFRKSDAISIILSCLFIFIGLITAYIYGKMTASGVIHFANVTADISRENGFRYRMNTIYSDDESAEMVTSVNLLLDAVQKQFARTESLLDKVREAVAVLASSTAEMRAVADRQADDSHAQAGRVNDLAGTGSEIAAAAVQISHKSTSVKEAAEKTLESCREGMKRIENAVAQIAEANKRADEMMNRMAGLEDRFGEIEMIAGTISDVSDRTELLSLNAALEAAGARKYGKRFAVVSSEVKRLAVRIGSMTSEIRGQLGDLRLALQETASATRDSANAVEEGVTGVTVVQSNLDQLSKTAEKTYTSAIEINISTREQTMASERLAETLREMSDLATQVASGSEESRKAIEDISQIALSMNDLLWTSGSSSD